MKWWPAKKRKKERNGVSTPGSQLEQTQKQHVGNICMGKKLEFYPSLILHTSESPGDVNGVGIPHIVPAGARGLDWMFCLLIMALTWCLS